MQKKKIINKITYRQNTKINDHQEGWNYEAMSQSLVKILFCYSCLSYVRLSCKKLCNIEHNSIYLNGPTVYPFSLYIRSNSDSIIIQYRGVTARLYGNSDFKVFVCIHIDKSIS